LEEVDFSYKPVKEKWNMTIYTYQDEYDVVQVLPIPFSLIYAMELKISKNRNSNI